MYLLPYLYGRQNSAIGVDSQEIQKFDQSAQGVLKSNNSNNLVEDVNGALELSFFLFNKAEEYSWNNLGSY